MTVCMYRDIHTLQPYILLRFGLRIFVVAGCEYVLDRVIIISQHSSYAPLRRTKWIPWSSADKGSLMEWPVLIR